MDAFESLVATLLQSEGYWTTTSFKVDLTKQDKRDMDIPCSPRWEIDVLAYSGSRNEILAVECKSFLYSPGVTFRNGHFEPPDRYKLFTRPEVRGRVLSRLAIQREASGVTGKDPEVILALATGKIARKTDREGLRAQFEEEGWKLFNDDWIRQQLRDRSETPYENDVAHVCSKILLRSTGASAKGD